MTSLRSSCRIALTATLALSGGGCSVRKTAVDTMADTLAHTAASYAADDDPELVGQALPFGLKTMEGLLEESPRHAGLLLAAASGFAQYAYGWVQQEADAVEARDLARATELRGRAQRLYLRARDYGLRGLELEVPGLGAALRRDPQAAAAGTNRTQVPLLYWTAVAWARAIALRPNDAELAADQRAVEALARRALELDEAWELGSIHEFFIGWEATRQAGAGGLERARAHFDKALSFSRGRRAFPYLSFAESVSVARQDRAQFREMLDKALAVDVGAQDAQRLANLLAQQRARFQLGRVDELFLE